MTNSKKFPSIDFLLTPQLSFKALGYSLVLLFTLFALLNSAALAQNKGEVKGVLAYSDTGQPAKEVNLSLPAVIINEGKIGGLKFEGRDTKTDSSGVFTFKDVPPGKYVLVNTSLIGNPSPMTDKSGESIIVNMIDGKNTDLGKIYLKHIK